MYCKNCGNELKAENKFCTKCGNLISGDTEIKQEELQKKSKKYIVPVICVIGFALLIVFITLINNTKKKDASLLATIQSQFDVDLSEIKCEGGSAIGNVTLEDYLPYEGYQRYTSESIGNGTEPVMEEITYYLENGEPKYRIWSNLTEAYRYGALYESEKYYYTI